MAAAGLSGALDVCILGGGIPGLVFARLLQRRQPQLNIAVLDAGAPGADGKTIIIDRAAADCLNSLNALPPEPRAIFNVQVSLAGVFTKTIRGIGGRPLGVSIAPDAARQALRQTLRVQNDRLQSFRARGEEVTMFTESGKTLRARRLVIACPLPSLPPPFRVRRLPYSQTILSLQADSALPDGSARQHFYPRRVLVMVPRPDSGAGIIICAAAAEAGALSALPDSELSAYLSDAFGLPAKVHGPRFAYRPQLTQTAPLAHPPVILLGSGATSLHPIGAQAISLAIADARQLAAAVVGGAPALAAYGRRRAFQHRQKALLTGALALGAFGAGGLF